MRHTLTARGYEWFQLYTALVQSGACGTMTASDLARRADDLHKFAVEHDEEKLRERVAKAPRTRLVFDSRGKLHSQDDGLLDPGIPRNVCATPQVSLWLEWLQVHPDAQPHFEILDIRFGHNTLFPTAEPIPAVFFPIVPEDEEKRRWMETWTTYGDRLVETCQSVQLTVRNTSKEPRRFSAVFTAREMNDG